MILPGIIKLAYGRAKGIDEFSSTAEAFTASLAPLIAFPLVGAVITGVGGNWKLAILEFLSRICTVLVLPVVTYEFARVFNRKSQWLRTATALNWCFWLVVPAVFLAAIAGSIIAQFGLPLERVAVVVIGIAALYLLWNRWFILKSGLQINGWRAAIVMVVIMLLVTLLAGLPFVIALSMTGMKIGMPAG